MKSILLPNDFITDVTEQITIFDYHTKQEISKQQVILNQNTFSFLVEGTKEVWSDNSFEALDNSKFILMKAGHCLMTEKLSNTANYRSILLFFDNELTLNFISKYKIELVENKSTHSIHTFNYDNFSKHFVKSLMDIAKLSPSIQKRLLNIKLEEIILYLIEINGPAFLQSFITNNNNKSLKFIQTIEKNILKKLTLSELAFLCNMSVSTFKREFEKHYSDSPSRWFQNRRLEYAHTLLTQHATTASEIYLKVGYENVSSFIQAYKSKYNITPKQSQKQ
ncbi:helix-turn-helix domain-containing protein [Myroides odoratimimus]|uniref:helix-turn-helix domain-containing protein n=1 Tax=Myroides odoratimimus TaxID=76832 RepID=UPI000469BF1C|nr:AraC family transcriptional regulator [Myroides odoratimimus]